MRPSVVQALEERGYRVNTDCPAVKQGGASQAGDPRWLLTVRVDAIYPVGSVLTGSLFDTQGEKEVWKATAKPGFGSRYGSALRLEYGGAVTVDHLIKSGFGNLFATIETRTK
ncbi:MAG: hypothetical protein ABSD98_12940 [Candidatus Korobacteraceae bacterium]